MSFFVGLFVFLVWTGYRFYFPENLLLDELVSKPLIWLVPVYLVTQFKNLRLKDKNPFRKIGIGLMVGFALSVERLLVKPELKLDFSWILICISLATAVTEEIFFRGFLLNRWLKVFPKTYFALILNALFFTFTHIPIAYFQLNYRGADLFTYLLSNFVSGFVDVYLFFATGSLYAPIANHFIWNVFSSVFR